MTCVAAVCLPLAAQAPQSVTPERAAFDAWLAAQATDALAARRAVVASLTSADAVMTRRQDVRTQMGEVIGLLPTLDTPVPSTVTRTTRRDGYRIEHLIFESLPGLKVTGRVCLARPPRFVVLAYDPPGQGERRVPRSRHRPIARGRGHA